MQFIRCMAAVCILLAGLLYMAGCHNEAEEEKEKISSIEFEVERVDVNVNEDFIVRLKVEAAEGKKNEKIVYKSINEGIVEIRAASNDGFIVKGLKAGTTVIQAKSKNVTKMLDVKVYGEDVLARYILLDSPVIEVNEGKSVQTSVLLYGKITEPDDNQGFQYQLETGKNNIAYNAVGNQIVVQGLERGYQELRVSHSKADFDNKILVIVKGVDQPVKYIYRDSNIFVIPNDGQYHDFDVALINGAPSDAVGFAYEVVDNNGVIEEISGSQTKCNVLAARAGSTTIKVSHPDAIVDFEVRVIVYDLEIPYIVIDQSFVLLSVLESAYITATVENARNGTQHLGQFSFKILENDAEVDPVNSIIEVTPSNGNYFIRALRVGTARVVVSNQQVQTSREILVVVRAEAIYRDDYYITTEQNVINTQLGDNMTRLYARLINGVSADANNFIWDLSDKTVVNLHTNQGSVRSTQRSIINSVFEAYCDIEPLKIGTAEIRITNSKAPESVVVVVVRVYPKGTFAAQRARVGCDGLIKVPYGSPQTVNLRMIQGEEAGSLNWSIEDTGVATLFGNAHGMTNVLSAARQVGGGITKMTVSGNDLETPHESIVIAGDSDYLASVQVIYADNIYQSVVEQQTIEVPILNSSADESWEPYGFSVVTEGVKRYDSTIIYAVMVRNRLKIMGKERGETDVTVVHTGSTNGSITLHIRVEPKNISIDQPYYFSGPDIKGLVRNIPTEFAVTMPGAPDGEKNKLEWKSLTPAVSVPNSTGLSNMLTGVTSGAQGFVKISHQNSKAEPKQVLVYVVATAAELDNVILGTKKENYLMTVGQEQIITLLTNYGDMERENPITWAVQTQMGDTPPITIDPHGDSCMVYANTAGNATINVTYEDSNPAKVTQPLTIYVSVVESLGTEKHIKGPAVVEIVRYESKIIGVDTLNLTQSEIRDIKWKIKMPEGEEAIANIEGSGDSAYLYGLSRGVGKIEIWQDDLNYTHYATLICANSADELASLYVVGVGETYSKILIGEEKKIKLTFGSNGFPESAKKNLIWKDDGSGKVKIVGKGESVSIVAQQTGETIVRVYDENTPDPVAFNANPQKNNEVLEIEFLVIDPYNSAYEFRGHQKMHGIVVGQSKQVEMKLYDGDAAITNYGQWKLKEEEGANAGVVSATLTDGLLNITAMSAGQEELVVTYDDHKATAKLLAYTALTEAELDAYYPIFIEKTNYLLQIGQSATVKIETLPDNNTNNINKITWGVENAGVIGNANFSGKKEVVITGVQVGNCVITVNYNAQPVGKIYVTVVGNDVIDFEKYLVTESIVGLSMETSKTTRAFHNLGAEASQLVWESLNPSVVTVSGSGEQATLTARGLGEAYVTVSYGSWLKRHIRVYVTNASQNINTYKAMNIDQQYYRMGVGEDLVLPVFFAARKPEGGNATTMWVDKYENKVVMFANAKDAADGSKIEVTALAEGVAVLEARNGGLNDPAHVLSIYIEVSKKYNNATKPVVDRYLTISKTVYMMNPDNPNEELLLRVGGVGYTNDELAMVKWKVKEGTDGDDYIDLFPNGQECQVRVQPLGRTGAADVEVSLTENHIDVRIIVTRDALMGFPHIVGDETIKLGLKQKLSFMYEVAEPDTYPYDTSPGAFSVEVVGASGADIVGTPHFTGNILEIEGKSPGQARIRIKHRDVKNYLDVVVLVTTTPDGMLYLTTRDNFTQVKIGEAKTLAVDVVGITNPGDNTYEWSVGAGFDDCIKLSYNGKQAQVEGLKAGKGQTVPIIISNTKVKEMGGFDLTVYVRISESNFNETYLTTSMNVVSVVQGQSVYLTAELVNGLAGEEQLITWTPFLSSQEDAKTPIIELRGSGPMAYVYGKHLGFGTARASHPNTVNAFIDIIVIVEKDNGNGMYISSNDRVVEIKPGAVRQLEVNLEGGTPQDDMGFNWEIINHRPADDSKKQVVEFYGNPSNYKLIYVKGLVEGQATVRVTHTKTNYALRLTIYVQETNKVEFKEQTINMKVGGSTVVALTKPPGTVLNFSASPPGIVTLSPTGPSDSSYLYITAVGRGITVITATAVGKLLTAEMAVVVSEDVNKPVRFIQTNDTMFNMIDWASAANRARVVGSPVGEKSPGVAFTEADASGINWEIVSGNINDNAFSNEIYKDSRKVIAFDSPTDVKGFTAEGKMANIRSLKPGYAEIKATHSGIPGYEKRVYVTVRAYSANYLLSPTFHSMQVGDTAAFKVSIMGDMPQSEYNNVTWKIAPDESQLNADGSLKGDVYGIEFREIGTDSATVQEIESHIIKGRKGFDTVTIIATEPGVFKLTTLYDERPIESIVYVDKPKILEIYGESLISIRPEGIQFIGLYAEPLNFADMQIHEDKDNSLDIVKIGDEEIEKKYVNKNRDQKLDTNNEWHQVAEVAYCGPIRYDQGDLMPRWLPFAYKYEDHYEMVYDKEIQSNFTERVIKSMEAYCANLKLEKKFNAVLVIVGGQREGSTRITIKHDKIERAVTVINSPNFGFTMTAVKINNGPFKKATEVRGKPGDYVTIRYNIASSQETITHGNYKVIGNDNEEWEERKDLCWNGWSNYNVSSGTYSRSKLEGTGTAAPIVLFHNDEKGEKDKDGVLWDGSFNAMNLTGNEYVTGKNALKVFNDTAPEISFKLNRCGYTVLRFRSADFNGGNELLVPVYVYYDKLDIEYTGRTRSGSSLSRLDSLQNAVYIANGDEYGIYAKATNVGHDYEIVNVKLATGPACAPLATSNVKYFPEDTQNLRKIAYDIYPDCDGYDYEMHITGTNGIAATNCSSLLSVEYLGIFAITYRYSTGGETKRSFIKNIMLYKEIWK